MAVIGQPTHSCYEVRINGKNMMYCYRRHLANKVEVASVCVRGSVEKVGLPWITERVSSPSFIL